MREDLIKSTSGLPAAKAKVFVFVWYARLKRVSLRVLGLSALLSVVLWASVFLYGAFYYAYMPAAAHERPVRFVFSTNCESDDKRCSFPSANLSLMKNGREVLVTGQPYVVKLELEMPESYANQQIGMFMVYIHFYTHHGEVVRSMTCSAMMQYKSFLYRTLETLVYFLPSLFTNSPLQRQLISVEFSDYFVVDPYRPAVGVRVEIQAKKAEIYSATFKTYARFTGLRYLLYNWPTLAAVCGVTSNFFFISVAGLFFWMRSATEFGLLTAFRLAAQTDNKSETAKALLNVNSKPLDLCMGCAHGSGDSLDDSTISSSIRRRTVSAEADVS